MKGQVWSVIFPHGGVEGEERFLEGVHLPALESARGDMVGVDFFHHLIHHRELFEEVVSLAAVVADVVSKQARVVLHGRHVGHHVLVIGRAVRRGCAGFDSIVAVAWRDVCVCLCLWRVM